MAKVNPNFVITKGWRLFYWFALCLVLALLGTLTLLSNLGGRRDPFPAPTYLIAAILLIVVIAYRWAFNKMAILDRDLQHLSASHKTATRQHNRIGRWYASEFRAIFAWRKSVLFSGLFTVAALIIALHIHVAYWLPTRPTRFMGAVLYIFIGTAFGACVWPGYRMFVFVHRLAETLQCINPFASAGSGIFNVGRTFIKFEAVGMALILIFGAAFEMSPYKLSNRLILSMSVTVSVLWAFWFFFTQGKIHKVMVRYKQEKQDWLAGHYERALAKAARKPGRNVFEELQRLTVIKKEVDLIPVWPVDTRALVTSLGLILSPIIATLIQRFIGK